MPQPVQPSLALQQIEAIVDALRHHYPNFDPPTRDQIDRQYAAMRAAYPPQGSSYEQGLILARFLEAIDAIPAVHDVVGALIAETRGPTMRGGLGGGDTSLLARIPPMLDSQISRAIRPSPAPPAPPMPAPAAPQPMPDEAAASVDPAPGAHGGTRADESAGAEAPAEAGAEATAPQAATIQRYPHLDCRDQAIVGQTFNLFVQLLRAARSPETAGMAVAIAAAPDGSREVEVVIRAHGFDVQGGDTRAITVLPDDDTEERFVLVPQVLGEQDIRVDLYQFGRRIGTIRRRVLVVQAPVSAAVVQPTNDDAFEISAAPLLAPPDLELCIEVDRHDGRTLYFTLHSSRDTVNYNHAKVGSVTLQGSPLEKMQSVYAEMSRMARPSGLSPDEQRFAERRLESVGNGLWDELVPEVLKRQYWRFKSQVRSLLITSDEPWVPWEMIKPYRINDDGMREDDPFWCQQFEVARWLSGPCAADRLPVGAARPVAPAQVNLAAVQQEVAFIEQLGTLCPDIQPLGAFSHRLQVLDWLETGSFGLLHFACHGQFDATVPNDSAITLGDGPLRPSDIRAHFKRDERPLIFINACHGGRVELSFTGLGGWAERLVKDSAVGAFVGAQWEVNDTLAFAFAQHFYKALFADKAPIATAFQQAREQVRLAAPGNSTWLAYVLYADPLARIRDQS